MQDRFAGTIFRSEEDAAGIPTIGEIGLNQFAPYLINRVIARWNASLSDEFRARGVTTVKMRVLAILSVVSSLTINELSVFAIAEQSSMSRILDSLEAQGYIFRTPRPEDMRIRDIAITAEGRAAFEHVWPNMYEMFRQMFDGIDEDEYRAFVSTLHRILQNTRNLDG